MQIITEFDEQQFAAAEEFASSMNLIYPPIALLKAATAKQAEFLTFRVVSSLAAEPF